MNGKYSRLQEVLYLVLLQLRSTGKLDHTKPFVAEVHKEDFIADNWLDFSEKMDPYHAVEVRTQVHFPDRALVQYDCGKLQQLAVLLRKLKQVILWK